MTPYLSLLAKLLLSIFCISQTGTTDIWKGASFAASPASLRAASESIKVGKRDAATVLLDELRFTFDVHGSLTESRHYIYRVETDDGVKDWAEASAEYDAWHQTVPEIKARVIGSDGIEHWLDQKTLNDVAVHQDAPDVYTDERRFGGPLPAVAVGSIVEEEIILRDKTPLFSAGTVFNRSLGWAVPAAHTHVVISHPPSLPLHFQTRLLDAAQVSKSVKDGEESIDILVDALPRYIDLPADVPSDLISVPQVEFATGTNWHEVASEYSKLTENKIRVGDVQAVLATVHGKTGNREEQIRGIVALLHKKVRYTGIEFGESSLIPQFPSETLKRGYGDCKDKATLLVAMLRASGIAANLALLDTGPGLDITPGLPGMGRFDHAIVFLPSAGGSPELWIDATSPFSQIGTLPWMDYGRFALIVSNDTTELKKTPELSATQNSYHELREFRLANYGPAKITETDQESGPAEADDREYYGGDSKESKDSSTQYVKDMYLAESLTSLEHGDLSDLNKPAAIKFVASGKRGNTDLTQSVVAIRTEKLFRLLPKYFKTKEEKAPESADGDEAQKPRSADWQLAPFTMEWDYKIYAPSGFKVRALPPAKDEKVSFLSFTQNYSANADGTVVDAVLRLENSRARFTADEGRTLRDAVLQAQAADPVVIFFENTAHTLIAGGKFREGLALYRKIASENPKEAIHRLRLANAFLSAGLGELARDEAHAATVLEPNSSLAFQVQGEIQLCDLVGRQLKKGMDTEGAIASFRKAIALKPSDAESRGNLGVVLEHDRNGERYAPGALLADAITVYRELKAVNEEAGKKYDDNILFDLFYSGDFKGLLATAATLPATDTRNALVVASTAVTSGADAAANKGVTVTSGESAAAKVIASAANLLIRIRKYPEASTLLMKIARGQANETALLQSATLFAKARPYEQIKLDPSDPRSVVLRLFEDMIGGNLTYDGFQSVLFHSPVRASETLTRKDFDLAMSQLAFQTRAAGLPLLTVADLVSTSRLTAEGNDENGYKVILESPGAAPQSIFIIKTPDGYKIVALSASGDAIPEELAFAALDELGKNNLAAARVWLDRAREIISMSSGDDPLDGQPFPYFWSKGAQADAAAIRTAALVLMPSKSLTGNDFSDLKRARDSVSDKLPRARLTMVLGFAVMTQERWQDMAGFTAELVEAFPDSQRAFALNLAANERLGKYDECEKMIRVKLAAHPDELAYMHLSEQLAGDRGNPQEVREIAKSIIDKGRATLEDFNSFAWEALLLHEPIQQDSLDAAQRANQLTKTANFSVLHTLACLEAAAGKTAQARETLLKAMDAGHFDEPNPEIWFGFGLIAEQYGESAAATKMYAKLEKPKVNLPNSTYAIAQQHISALSKTSANSQGTGNQ